MKKFLLFTIDVAFEIADYIYKGAWMGIGAYVGLKVFGCI